MAYQTKQQQAVLHCLRARAEECISAAELSEDLRHEGLTVGLATVYRQLDRLTQQGLVHKVTTEEGALYQYCPQAGCRHDCFLLRCERCGRIWTARIWRRSAVTFRRSTGFISTPAGRC